MEANTTFRLDSPMEGDLVGLSDVLETEVLWALSSLPVYISCNIIVQSLTTQIKG